MSEAALHPFVRRSSDITAADPWHRRHLPRHRWRPVHPRPHCEVASHCGIGTCPIATNACSKVLHCRGESAHRGTKTCAHLNGHLDSCRTAHIWHIGEPGFDGLEPKRLIGPSVGVGSPALLNSEDLTVYKIAYTAVDEKPEVQFKCLKRLVGERGFDPPTPWSRTRCSTRLSHSPT